MIVFFDEFVLVKDLLSRTEKREDNLDYLHIQTVKKQDKSPRHSFDEVLVYELYGLSDEEIAMVEGK